MLCSSDGYPYQAVVYAGKEVRPSELSLGEHVVLELAKLVNPSSHKLFFDNSFSSHQLLLKLQVMPSRATETAREGRFAGAPFTEKKQFKKKLSGHHEYLGDGSVCMVRWRFEDAI